MNDFFVPFKGKAPATVCVNGHEIVFLAQAESVFSETDSVVQADHIKEVSIESSPEGQRRVISDLALAVGKSSATTGSPNLGVVIVPAEASLSEVLEVLEKELPWVQ